MTAPLAGLAELVGRDVVTVDQDVVASYGVDLTGRFRGRARAVAVPRTADEVAAIVAWCDRERVPVVPQGGHSGLVGGGTPRDGELVLSLRRLDRLGDVDPLTRQVTVGAGATLAEVQTLAAGAGLMLPVDFSARGAATLGGLVATNAGGALAARYGSTRVHVAGVEAVLASGAIVRRTNGLVKDNAGWDVGAVLVGSEGTLGVITAVRLQLLPAPLNRLTVLAPFATIDEALGLLRALRAAVPSLESIDWLDRTSMRRVCERLDVPDPSPADGDVHVVFDVACDHDPLEELQRVDSLPDDARVAVDSAGRAALWRYREALNETISALGVPHKLDVSVPVGRTGEFARRLRALVRSDFPRAEVLLFGHLADGNVHVNLLGLDPAADDVDEAVLRLVADCRGSISAEHGVGVAKRRWLHLTRTPGEIAAMRAVKRALDPNGILNPGRLLPD